ncbi:hypothetical protein SH449x_003114 [Pirellulaceae bacterium SH449]
MNGSELPMPNRTEGVFSALLLLCLSPIHLIAQQAPNQIPFEYSNAIVLGDTRDESVYVIQGMSDPVMYSSRAHLSVWKFQALSALYDQLDSQGKSGPLEPRTIVAKGQCQHFALNAVTTPEVDFQPHGMVWSWMAGNEIMGWIQLQSNDGFKVCYLMELKKEIHTDFSKFFTVDTFIKNGTDEIVKRSGVHRIRDRLSQ